MEYFFAVVIAISLAVIWAIIRIGKTGYKEDGDGRTPSINTNGTSPFDIRPIDMERATCAERAFLRCRYAFWNDIYGFGSMNAHDFNTLEDLIVYLSTGDSRRDDELVENALNNAVIIPLYVTVLPGQPRDISIWAGGKINNAEELSKVMDVPDPTEDKFFGFVYITKKEATGDNDFLLCGDREFGWRDVAWSIANSEINRFEQLVEAQNN